MIIVIGQYELALAEVQFIAQACLPAFLAVGIVQFIRKCALVNITLDAAVPEYRLYGQDPRRPETQAGLETVPGKSIFVGNGVIAFVFCFIDALCLFEREAGGIISCSFPAADAGLERRAVKAAIPELNMSA